ncbi:MAG: 3'(2'),5'-bisphosphate nucleotidase CysQ [Cytophagales bacterium]|nr:3'(2'),5'-bisphosphate nucleotidase CysQ [Cytophagales bacterium]
MVDIHEIIQIASQASKAILDIYNDDKFINNIDIKPDHSPVTHADSAANHIIVSALQNLYPHIPIISEEQSHAPYEIRKHWHTFWLIDPLDGTKEYIKRNGQFTVNISLIENGTPVIGVIHIPVLDTCYYAIGGQSYIIKNGTKTLIKVSNKSKSLTSIGSSSHASEVEHIFLSKFDINTHIHAGSSLKFCYVADGTADIYYREGPTMEWDTAAGHCIVQGAGGSVEGLTYNKPDLRNGSFCCYGF